ncbi:MAG: DUF1810 domain-containing protein [Luteolibacter sp.]
MNPNSPDPFNLHRFVTAQHDSYVQALSELKRGRKTSHWMWFIFPQFAGLGRSEIAHLYAIKTVREAEAYLAHPILGPRILECCDAVLLVKGRTASEIFGFPDDLKLRSSITLFSTVAEPGSVFDFVLEQFFGGDADRRTLELLDAHS